jgi:hypothetical protein
LDVFYLIFIDPFNFQKIAPFLYTGKSFKKISLKLGAKGLKEAEFCADFKNV